MALKASITKVAFDKLGDDVKEHYTEGDDGKYNLDVDGMENPAALKRAKDRVNEDNKTLKKELRESQDRVKELEGDDTRKTGDIDKITAQKDRDIGERDAKITKLKDGMASRALDMQAMTIASKIAKSPNVMLPHVKAGLVIEWDADENPVVKVKGADGKPSSTGMDAFEKSLRDNKDFSDIIIASKASGGGGAARNDPSNSGSAGHSNNPDPSSKPANLSSLNPSDLAQRIKERKEAAAQGT